MKRTTELTDLNIFGKKEKSENTNETTQINQPPSLLVCDLADPEVSSSFGKVSFIEGEQELLFKNDVGKYFLSLLPIINKLVKMLTALPLQVQYDPFQRSSV